MVILIFIFLTPNRWFSGGERDKTGVHQSPVVTTLVLRPEDVGNEEDKGQIEKQVRALTGRTEFEVIDVRRKFHSDGRTRSFEVDIR